LQELTLTRIDSSGEGEERGKESERKREIEREKEGEDEREKARERESERDAELITRSALSCHVHENIQMSIQLTCYFFSSIRVS